MLAKDPGDRYQTAGDLLADARRYMGGNGPVSDDATVILQPTGAPPSFKTKKPHHGKTWMIAAAFPPTGGPGA